MGTESQQLNNLNSQNFSPDHKTIINAHDDQLQCLEVLQHPERQNEAATCKGFEGTSLGTRLPRALPLLSSCHLGKLLSS